MRQPLELSRERAVRKRVAAATLSKITGKVDAATKRLAAAGHVVDVQTDETCCYAVQK